MQAQTNITALESLRQLIDRLVVPPSAITDAQERRRASLVAGMLLAMLVVGLLFLALAAARFPDSIFDADFIVLWVGWGITIGIYGLARRGYTDAAAAAMIVVLVIMLPTSAAIRGGQSTLVNLLIFPILLSAIFFSTRHVLLVLAVSLAYPLVLSQLDTQLRLETQIYQLSQIIVLGTAIVIVYAQHMRALEEIRRYELQNAYEVVRASEAALERRVLERTFELELAKNEAVAARHAAEEADRTKSQFLASMSHELRTPLNSILTFSELMAMGTFGDVNEEQHDYLHKMLYSGRHLLALINDVLDITKIQSGMMKLFIEEDFNVVQEMETIAASTQKMLKDKPVELVVDIDRDIPMLRCDKRRVRQVLLNLLSNAIKFTEEGTITFSAKNRTGEIFFAVIDTGPGIEMEHQELIFEPFVQTETGIHHSGGTGLGLPISKKLVEAHQGKLWLESAAGQGSAFYFTLPLQADLSAVEVAV